jgi:LL-H family phage holin
MIDLTDIFSAVITLLLAVVTTLVIPYIKTKVSTEQFETIKSWVKVAVQAAEMIFTETGMGAAKKEYVIEYLNTKGYKLDTDTLNNLIEAAVLELKKS